MGAYLVLFSFSSFFVLRQFDWAITKKIEILETPQKYNVLCDDVMPPFWPNYKSGQGRTLGKPYIIKSKITNMW
jgi:hypothetical protein